jgi:RNA ligase (TIGR02306 family)
MATVANDNAVEGQHAEATHTLGAAAGNPAASVDGSGEEERKLATVRRVKAVRPIAGADLVEVVEVDGWQLVAKVSEFRAGDLCVYFEIDSFLPVQPHFEFLRKACFKSVPGMGDGFRLKTIKLRGELSQGLALPLNLLSLPADVALAVGTDLTQVLGVRKYEAPSAELLEQRPGAQPRAFKAFPDFLCRTDQERIQNCFASLLARKDIASLRFEVTLKLDGSSLTAFLKDGVFGVCSRNLQVLPDDSNMFWAAMRADRVEERLRHVGRNIALQGELMGPGIQRNRERVAQYTFFLFAAFDIDAQRYLLPDERLALLAALNAAPLEPLPPKQQAGAEGAGAGADPATVPPTVGEGEPVKAAAGAGKKSKKDGATKSARGLHGWDPDAPGIKHAPILDERFDLAHFKGEIAHALAFADRPSAVHAIAEGVVLKCTTQPSPTFKIISNKYLLKCEE